MGFIPRPASILVVRLTLCVSGPFRTEGLTLGKSRCLLQDKFWCPPMVDVERI